MVGQQCEVCRIKLSVRYAGRLIFCILSPVGITSSTCGASGLEYLRWDLSHSEARCCTGAISLGT